VFQWPQASIRWVGNEAGFAPYPAWNGARYDRNTWGTLTAAHGDPDGDRWLPNECDARIRNTWFWRTDNAPTLKSVDELMEMYERSVGHGAVLLLNHTPDPTGLIPEADAARAAEFGREIERRYGIPVIDTSGRGEVIEMSLSAPTTIDAVISMEDITQGERVRAYVIEANINGQWKELCSATAIGHKKTDRIPPLRVSALRLRITKSVGEPVIRRFAAYLTTRQEP
jgi:alpha-L-fucosidase